MERLGVLVLVFCAMFYLARGEGTKRNMMLLNVHYQGSNGRSAKIMSFASGHTVSGAYFGDVGADDQAGEDFSEFPSMSFGMPIRILKTSPKIDIDSIESESEPDSASEPSSESEPDSDSESDSDSEPDSDENIPPHKGNEALFPISFGKVGGGAFSISNSYNSNKRGAAMSQSSALHQTISRKKH